MNDAQSKVFGLSSARMPEDVGLRRGLPSGVIVADATQMVAYDDTTLIYDCFYRADRDAVVVYLPKMLQFEPMLRNGTFHLDDQRVDARIRQFRLYDRITLPATKAPAVMKVTLGDHVLVLPVNRADPELFAGENCLYTMQKDQDLAWIRDWAAFHVAEQGATAALVCDNGSTRYTSKDVLNVLTEVPGLNRVAVVDVPFSWGPAKGVARRHGRTKFLQVAIMNAMRDRFLADARAVLNCDIDELFLRLGKATCFDRAASGFGVVAMNGAWRFAAPSDGTVLHQDHWMQAVDPPSCSPKYCASPSRGLGRMSWGIHGLEALGKMILPVSRDFKMIHCRNISTSWKADRQAVTDSTLTADEPLREKLSAVFTT